MAKNWWEESTLESAAPKNESADEWWSGAKLENAPQRTWGEAIKDTGAQLAEGVNTTLGAIPSVVAPQSKAAGFFRDNADYWRDQQSDVLKGRIAETDKRIAEAGKDGVLSQIGTAASEYWNDPAQAARLVATNLPSMAATLGTGAAAGFAAKGVAAARGLDAANKAALAAKYGTTTSYATNAALNAGGARGEAFEDLQKSALAQGMTPEQAEQAGVSGSILPGVVGGVAGAISGKIGLEKAILGQATTGAAMRKAAGAFGAELAGEQIEELAPKVATNYQVGRIDPGRTLTDDLGRTMVETAIGSGPGAVVAGGAAGMRTGELPPSPGAGDPTTSPGAADPNAPVPPGAAPVEAPEAPDLTTSPGAGVARDGMDFTREVDTSGLSLQDPAELERARAATVDYQPTDTTPQWETSMGAAAARQGLDMPAPEFDTDGLGLDPIRQMVKQAADAGGALSTAAGVALDLGATNAQFLGATGRDVQLRQTGPGVTNESNVIDVDAREVPDQRGIPTARRLTNDQDGGARATSSQPLAIPAPTNLREGLERIRAQRQEAANAQAAARQAAAAAQTIPAARPGAVEAAGPATIPATTGVARESQASQTQQGSAQPTQAGGAATAGPAAAATAGQPATVGGSGVQAAGVSNAATAVAQGRVILQNRNRATPSSIAQMRSIAARPDYGRLGFSRDFANGAPVVAGGVVPSDQMGRQDVATASDGRRIPVQYAVVDAGAVLTSNRADGTTNTDYGNPDIPALRAIAGNGRIAGLQAAYDEGSTATYRQELAQDAALHGISPEVIATMTQPVLVRVMPADAVTADIGDVSNTVGNLDLSAVEQANNDANRVALDALQFAEDGSITPEVVRQFVRAMPQAERGQLLDTNGQPTRQAVDRLSAAVFAKAFGNDQLTNLYAQAQDPEARLIMSALAQVAPKMARLEGAGALDVRDVVAQAAEIAVNARRQGVTLARAAQQMDMASDPDVGVVLDLFAANSRSVRPVVEALERMADMAYTEASKPAEDMFGAVPRASRTDIINQLGPKNEQGSQNALEDATGREPVGQMDEGRGAEPAGRAAPTESQAGRSSEDAAARDALAAAIARSNQDGGSAAAQTAPAAEPAADQGLDQPEALELASQTPAEWLADSASERFSVGRSLTKAQRRQVLASLVDAYKAKGAQREFKGLDGNGNERYGYIYSPDLFEKSDITGAMIRYYVTLPDGRIAHPSELFPDVSASDVERMALEQDRKRIRLDAFDNAIKPYYSDFDSANLMAVQGQVVIEKNGRFAIIPERTGAIGQARQNGWELASPSGQVSEQSAGTRAVREQQDGLTSYTAEEATQRQEAAEQAAKAEAARQRAADQAASQDENRKRIAQAGVRAADRFELGQDPLDSLTGQGNIFDAPAPSTPTAASDDEGRERFTLSIEMFGDVPYRASKPVDAGSGEVVSSRVITTKTKLTAANAQALGLPKDKGTVYAWRVSVIRRADGAAHSVIEAMATDNGRSPDGEVLAHFKEVENPEAMERIAPAIANAALSDWRAAQPQQAPTTTEAVAQPITRADVTAAQQQAAAIITERIDAMTAGEVNTIARRFLPTMGVTPTVSKERNKAAAVDFTKVNPLAAADEFGATLPEDVRRVLQADMEGAVEDGFVEQGGLAFSFAGARAATADKHALVTAQDRLSAGEDAETVRRETGWHRGADGRMRFEISDKDASMKIGRKATPLKSFARDLVRELDRPLRLSDVLDHPALFAAYPAVADYGVTFVPTEAMPDQARGTYSDGRIMLADDMPAHDALSTLLHEIQHGIQNIEGFATGDSVDRLAKTMPDEKAMNDAKLLARFMAKGESAFDARQRFMRYMGRDPNPQGAYLAERYEPGEIARMAATPLDAYQRSAGEAEARNTQARRGMTDAERRATPPGKTADVADSDVIVVFNGKVMENAPAPANVAGAKATTPIATIRAAITKAYGKLLDQLESKGLVTLTQTEDEAIEAAAQARAAKTGQSVEQARSTLRASVKNSVADQTQTENFQRWFGDSKVVESGLEELLSKPDGVGVLLRDLLAAQNATSSGLNPVQALMLALAKNDKIGRGIVGLVPVDVVNSFSKDGLRPEDGSGNTSMFVNALNAPVSDQVLSTFRGILTSLSTKLANAIATGRDQEIAPALLASDFNLREVGGLLSLQGSTDFWGGNTGVKSVSAGEAAKSTSPGLGSPAKDFKLDATALADLFNKFVSFAPHAKTSISDDLPSAKYIAKQGKPLVVYHGTTADVQSFTQDTPGSASGYATSWLGTFFSSDADAANSYTRRLNGLSLQYEFKSGANVVPAYLVIEKPYLMSVEEFRGIEGDPGAVTRMRSKLERLGHDGIALGDGETWVAFKPTQIKSAIGNNGNFDPANPDIRRSADGAIQGFFDPQTGQSFLIADNLTAEAAPGVLMHEVGIHMAADGSMNALFNRAAMMLKLQKGNPFIKAVQARMDAAGETSGEEAAAYIAEAYENDRANAPASVQRWLADLLAAVKAWMFKKGIMGADRLTVADIAAVARANARSMARDGGATGGQGFGTAFSRAPAGDQTQTEAFKRWFGDSKAVDANGNPLVVYHGTHSSFTEFKPNDALGGGMFFSPSPEEAGAFTGATGSNIMPVYLSAQKVWPKIVRSYDEVKAIRAAKSKGYDAIRVRDDQNGVVNWVVFDPTQVKSAIGNRGTFDPANPDIRFSRTTDAAKAVGDTLKSITVSNVKQRAGFKLTDYLGIGLQALGRRQIVDIYGDLVPLAEYNRLVQQMEADKNEGGAEADQLVTRWAKLPDEAKLADLMHEATLAQIDPANPYVGGDDKAKYAMLAGRFNALSQEAKQVYTDTRDAYQAHHAKVRSAIKERIERSEIKGERKAALLKQMDDEFFKAVKGVYFPLARFGQYAVTVKGPDGKVESVSRAETKAEAEALRNNLLSAFPRDKGFTVGRVMLSKDFIADRDAVGRGFMTELYQVLDKQDMDAAQRAELEDTLGQLYLSSLPDLSWAKHGIHRKGTPGFSQDARRAYAQNMFHGSRYLAKLRYSDLMHDELTAMQKHVDDWREVEDFDQNSAQRVVDEMNKRHESLMNPKSNPLSTALTSLGFVFHLGLSPASAMVNLSQTALVAYPIMGAKWGFNKASAALLKASAEAAKGKNDITGSLNADERAAYDEAVRAGTIDVTMAHDLAGIAQGEDAGVMWKIRPVMRWASFLFHHAERFNRQVTFVAAYRLAREAGADHKAACEQATKATYDGHFDYGAANRPRIMQGNVAKVLLLFKQYGQNMVYTLARNAQQAIKGESPEVRAQARKALGGLLAMHAAAAGALGLPMVTTLLAAASMIGGDDDEPWDAKVALQNMLADTLGQKPAEVLAHGLSRLTPWDISGRVGLDKLIFPDVQEGLEGQRLAESAMAAALGPVAGIGVNVLKGAQHMSEGRYALGLEAMLPSALRGPVKAIRYANEGVQDKSGISILDEVSPAAVAGQALGFSPSQARNAQEGKSAVMAHDRALGERRQELLTKAARATMAKDAEARAEAMKEIERFNQKNPTRRITPLNVLQSVRNRNKRIDQAQGGIYLPKNRRDAMEAGRFAMEESE